MRKKELMKKVACSFMTAAVVITTVFAIPTEGNVYANDTTYEMTEGSLYDVEESVTEVGEKLKADSETDFDYYTSSLNGQNCIYIHGYHGKRSEITIPEQINGIDVIYIDIDDINNTVKVVNIPKTVKKIYGFAGLVKLEKIVVSKDNSNYSSADGVLYNKTRSILVWCPLNKMMTVIPKTVKIIDNYAFYFNKKMKELSLPSSIREIREGAFYRATAIQKIEMENSVTILGSRAFCGCTSLKSVKLSNKIVDIKSETFYGCTDLEELTFPEGVKSIGQYQFGFCAKLKKISLPSSLESINNFTFVENVIGYDIYYNGTASKWKSLTKSLHELELATKVYCKKSNNQLVRGNGNTELYNDEYRKDGIIYKVNGNEITVVGYRGNATIIKIPESIDGKKVTAIEISDMVADNAKEMIIPQYVKEVLIMVTSANIGIEKYTVDSKNKYLSSYDGIIYNKMRSILYACPQAKKDIKFAPGVKVISGNAFIANANIEKISIPNSVHTIGDVAFAYCYNLKSLEITDNVENMGYAVVGGCVNLKKLTLSSKVKELKEIMPCCMKLETLTIPYGVVDVDLGNEIYNLKTINLPSTVKDLYLDVYGVILNYYGSKADFDKLNLNIKENVIINYKKIAAPTLKSVTNVKSGVELAWSKVKGAKTYNIYRKNEKGVKTLVATVNGSKTSYVDTKPTAGCNYTYTITATTIMGTSAGCKARTIKRLLQPTLPTVTNTTAGVKVAWKQITGTKGYYIYRKTANDSWEKIANIKDAKTLSYVDKTAVKGKTYYYSVKAYNGTYTSSMNKDGSKIVR